MERLFALFALSHCNKLFSKYIMSFIVWRMNKSEIQKIVTTKSIKNPKSNPLIKHQTWTLINYLTEFISKVTY